MLKRYFFVLIFICCLSCFVRAQYHFDSWTTDDGLPQNSVRAMRQTSDGYLWLSTLDGLARFDGVRFTVFNKSNSKNLPGNRFINLFAESDDTLWVCTEDQGLIRYRAGEFQNFTTKDGLPSDFVYEISKDSDGNILAFTRKGSARFDGKRFISVSPVSETHNYKRLSASSGNFWELNKNSLILTKNGEHLVYELPENVKKNFYAEYDFFLLVNLFEDRSGALWITVNNGSAAPESNKLLRFAGEEFEEIKTPDVPPSIINGIAQDRHGDLWLATTGDGACRLKQNHIDCYAAAAGLADNISQIIKDREGGLWIATDNKGIFRLSEQVITPVSKRQNLEKTNSYAILEARDGAIWLGSLGGLAKYANGRFTNLNISDGLIYTDVQSIFEDTDGRLWIGSFSGVEYLENGKFYDFNKNLGLKEKNPGFFDIHRDRTGVLWLASSAGLFRYDGGTATLLTTADGLPGNNVKAILENDDGSFWIATYDGIALLKDGKFTVYTENEGLAGNHVRSLFKDETGTLWIGTYDSGLSRFKDRKFTNFSVENGLSSNGVFQILEDSRQNFWMSSNQGIYRVSRTELNEFADGKRSVVTSTLFGKSDGMLNTEVNGGGQPAGTKTKDGKLWFPTQDGAAIVNPEAVGFNPLPPPVVIENVKIENKPAESFSFADRNPQTAIVLEAGQDNLEIIYTGLSFIKPEQIRFRYKLEGLDSDWTEAGTRRTVIYPYLPPGNYTFRVIAANSDNVWNEQGASVKITVRPPFYQTWLFFAACFAVIGLIIFVIYRSRIVRLQKARQAQEEFSRGLMNAHESERRRIAAELHDSIGQSLAMIKNRLVFNQMKTDDAETKEQLELIASQTSQTINEVREISYNLRPYLLERLGLTEAIKSLLDEIADAGQMNVEAEIDDVDNVFDAEREMILYRVLQESLSNAVKHAEAENIRVAIKKTDENLTIVIADDGKGFDADEAAERNRPGKGGFGLIGMTERIRMLGGRHTIETAAGAGTKISIIIILNGLR